MERESTEVIKWNSSITMEAEISTSKVVLEIVLLELSLLHPGKITWWFIRPCLKGVVVSERLSVPGKKVQLGMVLIQKGSGLGTIWTVLGLNGYQ